MNKVIVFVAALAITCTWAAATPVAMVTDLVGSATIDDGKALELLDEINVDVNIIVSAESNLVVVYFDSGIEYTIAGQGRVSLKLAAPVSSDGATTKMRTLGPAGEAIRINPAGKAQASLVLRDSDNEVTLELLSPINPRINDLRPEFTWQSVPGAKKYRFELTDSELDTVVEATVETSAFTLPEGVELEPGGTYMWEIVTQQTLGERISSYASFTVVSKAQQDMIKTLKPGPNASVSQQIVFAVWLDQNGFTDDAEKLWNAIKKVRPGLDRD